MGPKRGESTDAVCTSHVSARQVVNSQKNGVWNNAGKFVQSYTKTLHLRSDHCQLIDLQIWSPYQNSSEFLGSDIHVPEDYLVYTAQAMSQLSICGCSNALYKLSKGIGTMRPDNSDSCFPCKRMPMGVLEYMADFFASVVVQQIHCVHCVFSDTLIL